MEKSKEVITELHKSTEREKLELIEKRVEIQKKRLEVRKEKLGIEDIVLRKKIALDEQKTLIDKICELRYVLTDWTVDEERTIMASEPFITPTIVGERREIVIRKLMELIKRI